MYSQAVTFLYVINVSVITFGIALNGFIVTANMIWWLKSRPVQSLDVIILNLGLVRLLHLMLSLIYNSPLFDVMTLHYMEYALAIFLYTMTCLNNYSMWTGALLCIFYCLKITNCNHRFFIYLKLNISSFVRGFLIASLAISMVCSLPSGWYVYNTETINSTNVIGDFHEHRIILNYFTLLIIYMAGSAFPLFLFCSAFCLMIGSLWSHSRHMKNMSCGFRPPKLDAHLNAVKNMVSFIFLYLICFISSTLFPFSLRSQNKLFIMLCIIGVMVYPSLHSFVLIWSYRRLNRLIWRVVQLLMGKPSDGLEEVL